MVNLDFSCSFCRQHKEIGLLVCFGLFTFAFNPCVAISCVEAFLPSIQAYGQRRLYSPGIGSLVVAGYVADRLPRLLVVTPAMELV